MIDVETYRKMCLGDYNASSEPCGPKAERIQVQLFESFRVTLNHQELRLKQSSRAFFCTASGGRRESRDGNGCLAVSGEVPRGFSYSSQFFQAGHMGLISDLMRYDLVRILRISLKPVRSCGIRPEEISCDYYDMLDGQRSMGDVADFLPGYPWSAALFCSSRVEQQAQWGGCRPERRAVRVRSGRVQAESGL